MRFKKFNAHFTHALAAQCYTQAMNATHHKITFYPPQEEKLNILTHALGFLLSVAGLVLLVVHAARNGTAWHVVSFSIFGTSLILLYAASTIYHLSTTPQRRSRLRVVDHAAIYVLIAGTYTPFVLVTLNGALGWTLFGITWGLAVIGIILKLFFTGRYELLSTLMYVGMGWLIVFAISPLNASLPADGLFWLFLGGIAYTLGAVLYAIHKIPYNHALFHGFVLAGSASHFIAVYGYVLH